MALGEEQRKASGYQTSIDLGVRAPACCNRGEGLVSFYQVMTGYPGHILDRLVQQPAR